MTKRQGATIVDDRLRETDLVIEAVNRREFNKFVVISTGLAAIAPSVLAETALAADTPVTAPNRPRGGTVTMSQAGDPDSLDPDYALSGVSGRVMSRIYDSLIGVNEERRFEGILAESWEIADDGLEYTFHLRQGIVFHDGSAFNADAVKFTFDRILNPETISTQAGSFTTLKETIVIDPLTVKMVLNEPYAPLLSAVCSVFILPPAAVQTLGADFGTNPVGTGPWKFQEWVHGEYVSLVRNENYQNFHSYLENKGAPYLDQFVIRNILEPSTELAAFETDEVQIVLNLPPVEVDRYRDDPNYQIFLPTVSNWFQFVEFAMDKPAGEFGATWKPPFDDIRVRQAVGYALDVDTIIEKVLYGLYLRNYGMLSMNNFAYNPDLEQYGFQFDPEKAKALLDAAGWIDPGDGVREKDGAKFEVLMWTWNASPNDKISQVVQNQLAAVGISVTFEVLEVGLFLASFADGPQNFDMMAGGGNDPNAMREVLAANYPISRYRDQQYVKWLDQASTISDLDERAALYFEAQKKLLADAAVIPLWSGLVPLGARAKVKGFTFAPDGSAAYEDIYIEE